MFSSVHSKKCIEIEYFFDEKDLGGCQIQYNVFLRPVNFRFFFVHYPTFLVFNDLYKSMKNVNMATNFDIFV